MEQKTTANPRIFLFFYFFIFSILSASTPIIKVYNNSSLVKTIYSSSNKPIHDLNTWMNNHSNFNIIKLKRGITFYGTGIKIMKSNITIKPYGSGDRPILNGQNSGNHMYGIFEGHSYIENHDDWDSWSTYNTNINIESIEIKNYTDAGIRSKNDRYWTINNVVAHNIGTPETSSNSGLGEGIQLSGKDHTIKNCFIYENGHHGIFINSTDPNEYTERITIENNKVYNNYHTEIDIMNDGGGANHVTKVRIMYNEIWNNKNGAESTGIQVLGYPTDDESNITNIDIYYNLIKRPHGIGINLPGGFKLVNIYNNTVQTKEYLGWENTLKYSVAIAVGEGEDFEYHAVELYNNIGYALHKETEVYGVQESPVMGVISSDYNCWWDNDYWSNPINGNISWYDEPYNSIYSFRNATNQGAHSNIGTPGLNSTSLAPSSSSSWVVNRGKSSLGNDWAGQDFQRQDFYGNLMNGTPDIGAIEYYSSNSGQQQSYNSDNDADHLVEATSLLAKDVNTPTEYTLKGNYPNPFNPTTKIIYILPYSSNVKIQIFDSMGKLIKTLTATQEAGIGQMNWLGTNQSGTKVSSGVYYYKITAISQEGNGEHFSKSSKMILLK